MEGGENRIRPFLLLFGRQHQGLSLGTQPRPSFPRDTQESGGTVVGVVRVRGHFQTDDVLPIIPRTQDRPDRPKGDRETTEEYEEVVYGDGGGQCSVQDG